MRIRFFFLSFSNLDTFTNIVKIIYYHFLNDMHMKNYSYYFAVLFFLFISLDISAQTFPGEEWDYHEDPLTMGWDSSSLVHLNRYIIDSTVITGAVIIQNGKIAFTYGDIEENSYIASCRKSVLAMLYGKYVNEGTISLDKTIKDLEIDDVEGILPIEQQATVKDLISARSGVYHPEGYPGGMQQFAPDRGSIIPGTYWLYSNWDFNVAGYVFEKETRKNIYDEVEDQLALPLQMQDWKRELQNKQGDTTLSKYLAYPMWFSTRDMARIGLLMLNEGNWAGGQLIDKAWVDEMMTQRTTYEEIHHNVPVFKDSGVNFGYGYMWWLFENMGDPRYEGAYVALGAMGQAIAVFPAANVVVAYKTKAAYRRSNTMTNRLALLKKTIEAYHGELSVK